RGGLAPGLDDLRLLRGEGRRAHSARGGGGSVTAAPDTARGAGPPAAPPALLSINNIEVIYDEVILVLRGLSLEVPEGQIVSLLGSNGAGKSTTLKAASGLLPSEQGEVTTGHIIFRGEDITKMDAP